MSDELTPITRKETFLAKAGGQNVVTPTPITREETFLQAIIDNGSGGGGGGGSAVDLAVTLNPLTSTATLVSGTYSATREKLMAGEPIVGILATYIPDEGEYSQSVELFSAYYTEDGLDMIEMQFGGGGFSLFFTENGVYTEAPK